MIHFLPGLLLALALGAAGLLVGTWLPALGGVTAAILLGMLVGNLAPLGPRWTPGLWFAEKRVLGAAIVLLGLQLDAGALLELGGGALALLVGVVGLTVWLGPLVAKAFGLSPGLGALMSVGQGICGTSAIAAAARVVDHEEGDVAVSVGLIHALGTVGLAAVPAAAALYGLDAEGRALLLGGTLQSVGHVVAAGFAFDGATGELATVVKMARVAMLPVVVVLLGLRGGKKGEVKLPADLIAFVVAAAIGAAGLVPAALDDPLDTLTDVLLAVSMAAIGTGVRLAILRKQGLGVLGAGILLFAVQVLVVGGIVALVW